MGLIVAILIWWISFLTLTLNSGCGQDIARSHDRGLYSTRHNSRMIHERILCQKDPSKNGQPVVTKESDFNYKKSNILNNLFQREQTKQQPNGDLHGGEGDSLSAYKSVEGHFKEKPSQSQVLHGLVEPVHRRRFTRDAINLEKHEGFDLHQPVVKEDFSSPNDLVFQDVNGTENPLYQVANISDKDLSLQFNGSKSSTTQSILVTRLATPLVGSSPFTTSSSIASSVGALGSKIYTSVISDSNSVTSTSSNGNFNSGSFILSCTDFNLGIITSSTIDSSLEKFTSPRCDAGSGTLTSFISVSILGASASSSETLMPFIETSNSLFLSESQFTSSQFSTGVYGDFSMDLPNSHVHGFPTITNVVSSAISSSPTSTNEFDTSQDSEKNIQEIINIQIYSCQKCVFQIGSSGSHFSSYLEILVTPAMSAVPSNTLIHSMEKMHQLLDKKHSRSVFYDTDSGLVHSDILHPLEIKSESVTFNPVQTRVAETTHSVSVQTRVAETTHSVSVQLTHMSASQKYSEIITNSYRAERSVSSLISSFESTWTESVADIRFYEYISPENSSLKQNGTDLYSEPVESIYSSDAYWILSPFSVSSEDFLQLMNSASSNFTQRYVVHDTSPVSSEATDFWKEKISSSAAIIEPYPVPESKSEGFIAASFSSVGFIHHANTIAFDSSSSKINSFQTQHLGYTNLTSSRTTHTSSATNSLSKTIDIMSSMDLPTPELLVTNSVLTSEPIQSELSSESKIKISVSTNSTRGMKTQTENLKPDDSSDSLILHAFEPAELSSTLETLRPKSEATYLTVFAASSSVPRKFRKDLIQNMSPSLASTPTAEPYSSSSDLLDPTSVSELEQSSLEPDMPTPEPEPPSKSTELTGTPEPETHSSLPDKPSLEDTKPAGIPEPETPTSEPNKSTPDQAKATITFEQQTPTSEPNKPFSEPHIPESTQTSEKPKPNALTVQPELQPPSSEPETKSPTSEPEGEAPFSEPHSEPPTTKPKGEPPVTESEPETNPTTVEPGSKPPTGEPEHQPPISEPTGEPGHGNPEPEGEPGTFAEPQPDWDMAKELWKEAWVFHIYFFGPSFILIGLTCVLTIIRLWKMEHLLSRHYFLTLNVLVILFCAFRGLYLLMDAYNSRRIYPTILDYFLYSTAFPCLTSMFSILFYALLLATRVQALSKKVQKLWVLLVIICFHFALSITTDVIIGLYTTAGLLLLICQFFFVFWGLIMFIGYIVIFRRLYISAVHRQKVMVARLAAEHKANGVYNQHELKEYKHRYTLSLAIKVTFVSAFFGFACIGLELYGMFGVYGILKQRIPDPWPWWTYHTLLRSMELLMCISIAYVAAQPLKYLYNKGQGHTFFYLLPCKLLFCDRDSAFRSERGFSSNSADHMHLSESSNESHSAPRKHKLRNEKDIWEIEKARYEKASCNALKSASDSDTLSQDATLPVRGRHKKSMLIVEDGFVRIRREDEMSSITEQEFDTYSRSTDLISGSLSQSNGHFQRSYDGSIGDNISLSFPSNDEFSQNEHANGGVVIPSSWQIPISNRRASDLNPADIVLSLSMSDLTSEMETELEKAFQSNTVSDVDLVSNISLPVTLGYSTNNDHQCNVDFYQECHEEDNTPQTSPSVDNTANHSSAISTSLLLPAKHGSTSGEDPGIRKKLFDSV